MSNHKNCHHCRHYQYEFGKCPEGYILISDNPDSCLGSHYGICHKGNNEVMKKWWEENGHLPVNKGSECKCYEATDMSKALDNLIELGKSILQKN